MSIMTRSFSSSNAPGRRRTLILGLTGVGCLLLAGHARAQIKVYRIGVLEAVPASQNKANLDALRQGLASLGYVEGSNLVILYRSADGHAERFPELAADLVRLNVDLVITRGTPAAQAAKRATETIPVLMATMGDPRAIVASFARPGGNITGVTTFSTELTAKRIELLQELVPDLARIALLHNMGNPAAPAEWEETRAAARVLGMQARLFDVRNEDDIENALDRARREHIGALLIGADGLTQMNLSKIVERIARSRIPAAYPSREFVEAGGLFAYAVNYPALYFRFATYVDRILKGARPGDLPVEQPAKFELVINARTARSLGIAVPRALQIRADAVIE